MLQCILHPLRAHDVITGNVSVASINASGYRNQVAQVLQNFRNLLKTCAQRVFRARSIFDQDRKIMACKVQSTG